MISRLRSSLPTRRSGKPKSFLKERGATATLLSGSGSSVFGFFSDEESAFAASRADSTGDLASVSGEDPFSG